MAKKRRKRKKRVAQKEKKSSKAPLIGGAVFLVASGLLLYSKNPKNNSPQEPTPVVEQAEQEPQPTVEDIIKRHAVIEDPNINVGTNAIWYLVGMTHAAPGEKNPPEYVKNIQTDIYFLLRDLSKEAGITLVVGELVTGNKLTRPLQIKVAPKDEPKRQEYRALMKHRTTAPLYFAKKPRDTGYETLEFLEPDLIDLWILGEEEFKRKYMVADLAKYDGVNMFPQHSEENTHADQLARDPVGFMARLDKSTDLIVASAKLRQATLDARSRYYTAAAPALADYHQKPDFVFVTGRDHVKLMLEEYKSHRRVLVLRPKSDLEPIIKQ